MEKMTKKYEIAVNNAWEISQTLLDMEGGIYILAVFCELLQELLEVGNASGAASVVCKLHEVADVPFEQVEENITVWLAIFANALHDTLEETGYTERWRDLQ